MTTNYGLALPLLKECKLQDSSLPSSLRVINTFCPVAEEQRALPYLEGCPLQQEEWEGGDEEDLLPPFERHGLSNLRLLSHCHTETQRMKQFVLT